MGPKATREATKASVPRRGWKWRSQREVLLDLLRCAVVRDDWMTLDEMAKETSFPPASISAQLRHLRKPRYGAWTIERRLGQRSVG